MEELAVRIFVGVMLVGIGAMSARFRKHAAMDDPSARRSDENRKLIATRLFVAVPAQLLLLGDLVARGWFQWARFDLPTGVRWLGAAGALACLPLGVWMFRHLGTNVTATALTKDSHRLVTTGPYQWVRHPMYSIGMLLVASFAVLLQNAALLAWVGVFWVAWTTIVIPAEERGLEERFGDEYRSYRNRVRPMLPIPKFGGQ